MSDAPAPYVAAVKAWERKWGRLMTADESRAFGKAWDVFSTDWRSNHPGRVPGTAAPMPSFAAMDFGESWIPSK